eukprot:COSAG03_NODE_7618_length_893_cov_1.661209_1_plen_46_part_10
MAVVGQNGRCPSPSHFLYTNLRSRADSQEAVRRRGAGAVEAALTRG